jgi:hypothetical protein
MAITIITGKGGFMLGIEHLITKLRAGLAKKQNTRKTAVSHKTAVKKISVKIPVRDLGEPFTAHPVREHSPMRSPFHEAQRRTTEMPHRREPVQNRSSKAVVFPVIQNRDELEKAKFVCKAIDRHGNSPFTNVLHVEQTTGGSLLVATDGKRLHVAQIETRIPEGDYKPLITRDAVKICNPVEDANFPDWQRVVPECAKKKGTVVLLKAGGKNPDLNKIAVNEACKNIKKMTGAIINLNILPALPALPALPVIAGMCMPNPLRIKHCSSVKQGQTWRPTRLSCRFYQSRGKNSQRLGISNR